MYQGKFDKKNKGAGMSIEEIVASRNASGDRREAPAERAPRREAPAEAPAETPAEEQKPVEETTPAIVASVKTYNALKVGSQISDSLVAGQKAKIQVKCGKNLNQGDCGCVVKEVDPRLAVLQKFLDSKK